MLVWQSGNLVLVGFHQIAATGRVRHAIATRLGGTSDPPFAGLNLGLRTADDPERVRRHRAAFCAALALDPARAIGGRQVHGADVAIVGPKDLADRPGGLLDAECAIPDTDALIATDPGVGLFVLVADCTPILIVDPVRPAVAVVHAGWRGTARRIADRTARRLIDDLGCRPENLIAGIGPAIGVCCYEVDDPVIEAIEQAHPDDTEVFLRRKPNGRAQLDLAGANRRQLIGAGIRPDRIESAGLCTACTNSLFYSERREGRPAGRFGALIAIAGDPVD